MPKEKTINITNIKTKQRLSYADAQIINRVIKKGDIYYADLSPVVGSEQGGTRPVLVVQNDTGNKYSPTTLIVPITSQQDKHSLPTHMEVGKECGLAKNSIILFEQIKTIDKSRLISFMGHISSSMMNSVNDKLRISLGIA